MSTDKDEEGFVKRKEIRRAVLDLHRRYDVIESKVNHVAAILKGIELAPEDLHGRHKQLWHRIDEMTKQRSTIISMFVVGTVVECTRGVLKGRQAEILDVDAWYDGKLRVTVRELHGSKRTKQYDMDTVRRATDGQEETA